MFFAWADLIQQVIPAGFLQAGGQVGGVGAMPVVANSYIMRVISGGSASLSKGAGKVESAGCAGGLGENGRVAKIAHPVIDRFAWRSGCVGDLALA